MNTNSKNLIRLRALSPNNSVHVRIAPKIISEHDKNVSCKIIRYRENPNGKGEKKTHIIELSNNVISVYGIENPSKPYEYSVVCGDKDHAVELWNELFPDRRIVLEDSEVTNINLLEVKKLLFSDKFSAVCMPIMIDKREIRFVKSLNLSWITYKNNILPVIDHNTVGSFKVLDDGSMEFNNYIFRNFGFKSFDFLGNVKKAEEFIQSNFGDCMNIEDLNAGIKGLLKLNKTL